LVRIAYFDPSMGRFLQWRTQTRLEAWVEQVEAGAEQVEAGKPFAKAGGPCTGVDQVEAG